MGEVLVGGVHHPGRRDATQAPVAGQAPILCWRACLRFVVRRRWGRNPNGAGSVGSCASVSRRSVSQRGLGLEPRAHRAHLGDTPGEELGEQADDDAQDVMDEAHPALDPAHRARELDRIAAQLIGRGGQARGRARRAPPPLRGCRVHQAVVRPDSPAAG